MTRFYLLFDLLMFFIMLGIGFFFYRSQGRAAGLLAGYNERSPEARRHVDEAAMCRAYGRRMMVMALPFAAGAVIDGFAPGVGCFIAWAAWLVLLGLLLFERHRREK